MIENLENTRENKIQIVEISSTDDASDHQRCVRPYTEKKIASADARMARKLNGGTFDVKQYAEHPPVIHV